MTLAATLLAVASNAQDYLGQPESVLRKKTSMQRVTARTSPTTYTMKEGTRTFIYYINRNTGHADGLTVMFATVADRNKYMKEVVNGKKWQYTDTSKTSFRGMPAKDLQASGYLQVKHPQSKSGAVIFSVIQTPVRQKKLSRVK